MVACRDVDVKPERCAQTPESQQLMGMTTDNPTSSSAPAPAPRKRSGLRIFLWIVIVIVLIIVIGAAVVMFKLDEIVRSTVQTQSAASLNVPTQLQSANVSLLGGSVKLNGFDIGSPSGF